MEKKVFISIFVLIIVFLGNTGCLNQDDLENNNIKTIKIGLTDKISGFYPFINNYDISTMEVNFNIYDGLVDFDENYRIKPRLAISWNNPEPNIWRFNLRKNVKFHNNYNFSAEDVKFSIDIIKTNNSHVLKDLISSINHVKVIDDYTVDIVTEGPNPILLNKLVDIPIISKKYFEFSTEVWPIGTSAYKLFYYDEETITLQRFENFWGDKLEIKEAIFYVIEDDEDRKNKLLSRDIDIAENIMPLYIEEITNNNQTSVKTISSTTVVFLSFDFRVNNSNGFEDIKNPISDIRVRKALYHAIDTNSIIKDIKGGYAEPASQFLSPLIFGYNPYIEILKYDLNESKKLLKDAGYEKGFNITLDCPYNWYDDMQICEEISKQLSPMINVTLNPLSVEEYFNKILSRKSSFFIIGWIPATGDGGEIFDYILRSVDEKKGFGTYNLGYYSNPAIDNISKKIMTTMDPEIRLSYMQQGFQIAMEDIACIPLFINVLNYGITENIDWTPRSDMDIRVENIRFKVL